MKVLVIGYGKMGRIKSAIWHGLGAEVFIYDTDQSKNAEIYSSGFKLFNATIPFEGILDISTPAGHHIDTLAFFLEHEQMYFSTIIIEKPLTSSRAELIKLHELLVKYPEIKNTIVINETYYVSSALQEVKKLITARSETITGLSIELSKNRLSDTDKGRFFDHYLESIGIEVPHMVAIAEVFGIDIRNESTNVRPVIYKDIHRHDNQAFLLDIQISGVSLKLSSYLGDFRIHHGTFNRGNDTIRKVVLSTDKDTYEILFDPAPNLERQYSCIRSTYFQNLIMKDDHLKEFLQRIYTGSLTSITQVVGIDNSLKTSKFLLLLKEHCEVHYIGKSSDARVRNKVTVGEQGAISEYQV